VADIAKPYLVFLADAESSTLAKTALGVRDWAREDCVGQLRLTPATIDIGLPNLSPSEAAARGARSRVIGVAPVGGAIARGMAGRSARSA
jgi:hypothetical protein